MKKSRVASLRKCTHLPYWNLPFSCLDKSICSVDEYFIGLFILQSLNYTEDNSKIIFLISKQKHML